MMPLFKFRKTRQPVRYRWRTKRRSIQVEATRYPKLVRGRGRVRMHWGARIFNALFVLVLASAALLLCLRLMGLLHL